MKFTDEELSRILSAHANGEMRRFGWDEDERMPAKVCAVQAAEQVDDEGHKSPSYWYKNHPRGRAMRWFDKNYNPGWPLGKFLRELERQGLA